MPIAVQRHGRSSTGPVRAPLDMKNIGYSRAGPVRHSPNALWSPGDNASVTSNHGPRTILAPIRFFARKAEWSARRNFTPVLLLWSHQATGPVWLDHRPHSRQVTGAHCTEVAARQSWAEYSSRPTTHSRAAVAWVYSLGMVSRYSTVRSGTLTWREWGLWAWHGCTLMFWSNNSHDPHGSCAVPVRASYGPRTGISNVLYTLRDPYGARAGPARVPYGALTGT